MTFFRLKEWLAKQSERDQKTDKKKRETLEKKLEQKKHTFDDNTYHDQKSQVSDNLEDALSVGML